MRALPLPDKSLLLVALLCGGVAATAQAARLEVEATRLVADGVQASAPKLSLDWPAGATEGQLALDLRKLAIQSPALAFERVSARCALLREDGGWRCTGHIEAAGLRRGNLRLVWRDGAAQARLQRGQASLSVRADSVESGRLRIEAKSLPVDWLLPLLAPLWPEASLTDGALTADWEVNIDQSVLAVAGPLSIKSLGLDTRDGRIAAAGLDIHGRVALRRDARTRVEADLSLTGGELLAAALYLQLPAAPVSLRLRADGSDDEPWRLSELHWRDGDTLDLRGKATLGRSGEALLVALQVQADSADLATATERYARSLLAAAGLPDATATGSLSASLAMDSDGLMELETNLDDVDFGDGARIGLGGVDGTLRWHRAAERDSQLRWRTASLHGIDLSAGQLSTHSRAGDIRLAAPVRLSLLQGQASIERFHWQPATDTAAGGLELAASLSDIDLAALSAHFGWPAFSGRLGGQLPSARYEDSVLRFDGGLDVAVFDGRIRVDQLRLERPFGVAPTLSADIRLDDLDLKPLTGVFGFGEISGRLDGRIAGLRLVDWSPVAFDAHFHTDEQAKDRRRISQRAVNDLSQVGGGGLAAGLQSQALRLFDSFSYQRIGLGCRLANDVCAMSGIAGDGGSSGGYTIVEGAGLPRITVNGYQRRVDWPVLLQRLQAVSDGQAPRVE
ncbi:MAG: hypothetical protein WC995_04035 [Lysobacteraceae bacterium]